MNGGGSPPRRGYAPCTPDLTRLRTAIPLSKQAWRSTSLPFLISSHASLPNSLLLIPLVPHCLPDHYTGKLRCIGSDFLSRVTNSSYRDDLISSTEYSNGHNKSRRSLSLHNTSSVLLGSFLKTESRVPQRALRGESSPALRFLKEL